MKVEQVFTELPTKTIVASVGSGGGRMCERDHTTICFEGRTCVWEIGNKIRTKRERESHKEYNSISNNYKNNNNNHYKGYKITLYSDSLRAIALYAIYTNGLNLGY